MTAENQEHHAVAKFFFWTAFSIIIVISILIVKTKYTDEKEFAQYAEKAQETNNPKECENIKSLRLSSLCYSQFVEAGYDCTTEEHPSDACLIAQGVATKDDLFCDMVFFDDKVPENLECRVSVFIERYSDEGLSDCCHIK
ncbi:MAG: hypothetical protein AABX98_03065 [Nanoarchaeota archaeon]